MATLIPVALLIALAIAVITYRRRVVAVPSISSIIIDPTPDNPEPFGFKVAWIIIPTNDTDAVAESLGLSERMKANWTTGMEVAYNHWMKGRVFVSPPIEGWSFVVGCGLPDPGTSDEKEAWKALMETISEKFGEAQYFASNRVSSYTVWSKFVSGSVIRAFAFGDEQILDVGELTPEEADIVTQFITEDTPEDEIDKLRFPEEDDVLLVAERWSISPMTIEDRGGQGVGIVGLVSSNLIPGR